MKGNKVFILFVLFIILGIAVWLQEQSAERKAAHVPSELGLIFPEFESHRVASIVLGSFGGDVNLSRDGDTWIVEEDGKGFPADEESIDKLFDTTSGLEAIQVVSQNPDNHITFQVNASVESHVEDDDGESRTFTMGTMGTEVKLYYEDGSIGPHFFVGKNGSMDFMTTYVRKANSDTVLLAPGFLKMIYGKGNATAWKDLLICSLTPEQIASISIGQNDEPFVLEPDTEIDEETGEEQPVWVMTQPDRGIVNHDNLQKLLTMLRHFRATDFAAVKEDPAQYGFDDPAVVVSIRMKESDETKTLVFGNETTEKANQYYLKIQGDDTVYVVPGFRLESVPLSPNHLFPT
jgi:hypothetical protein